MHTAADIEECRLAAMFDHPHNAHAIAAMPDDELAELAHGEQGDEFAIDEFAAPSEDDA